MHPVVPVIPVGPVLPAIREYFGPVPPVYPTPLKSVNCATKSTGFPPEVTVEICQPPTAPFADISGPTFRKGLAKPNCE